MSSHHIVRDNQEAALLIADGEACSVALMEELLEWSPFVIVLDGALRRVLEWNIKVDVWLGDFDSGEALTERAQALGIERVHAPNQDYTDLQKGFEYLIGCNFHSVHVLWAGGMRMDHYFNNIFTAVAWSDRLNIAFIDDYGRTFASPKKFQKWYPKNTSISLIPCGMAEGVTTKNLVWNLVNETLQLPEKTSSSNRVLHDGFVEIEFEKGHLLIMENWDK